MRHNANPGPVLESIPNREFDRCVDIFRREDGSFGFNEFRTDPEDRGLWTLTSNYSGLSYNSKEAAIIAARTMIGWLE